MAEENVIDIDSLPMPAQGLDMKSLAFQAEALASMTKNGGQLSTLSPFVSDALEQAEKESPDKSTVAISREKMQAIVLDPKEHTVTALRLKEEGGTLTPDIPTQTVAVKDGRVTDITNTHDYISQAGNAMFAVEDAIKALPPARKSPVPGIDISTKLQEIPHGMMILSPDRRPDVRSQPMPGGKGAEIEI